MQNNINTNFGEINENVTEDYKSTFGYSLSKWALTFLIALTPVICSLIDVFFNGGAWREILFEISSEILIVSIVVVSEPFWELYHFNKKDKYSPLLFLVNILFIVYCMHFFTTVLNDSANCPKARTDAAKGNIIESSLIMFICSFILGLVTLLHCSEQKYKITKWFRSISELIRSSPLNIVYATYGTATHQIEVTKYLREQVKNNKLTITASNEIGGDPDPGKVKNLTINFDYKNKREAIIITEGVTKTIPS